MTVGTAPRHRPVIPSFRITSLVTDDILRLEINNLADEDLRSRRLSMMDPPLCPITLVALL